MNDRTQGRGHLFQYSTKPVLSDYLHNQCTALGRSIWISCAAITPSTEMRTESVVRPVNGYPRALVHIPRPMSS